MPFDPRPVTPHELLEASRFNLTLEAAKLYLKGLSPGLGMLGHAQLAWAICQSRRYVVPNIPLSDRRAVALRASVKLGHDRRGEPCFPWQQIVEAMAASGGLGPRYDIDSPQVAHVGKAIDEAHAELLAERLTARAAE